MELKRLPKIASNYIQNPHLRLKREWHKDAQSWLNHWGIKEEFSMGSKYNIKNTITSNFKDKFWEYQELEGKRKLRYYKEVVNPTLDNQNYLFVLSNNKKKMNISKIRTNSHELRTETERWYNPKTPWNDRICQICDSKQVEDQNNFFLDRPTLTHICSQFRTIYHSSNILDLLSQPTYSDIGALLSLLFDHKNKILKTQA